MDKTKTMDKTTVSTLIKDMIKVKRAFYKDGRTFEILKLVPTIYRDGTTDYRLTVKADWLTKIINDSENGGRFHALKCLWGKIYELRDEGQISDQTLMLLNGTTMITDAFVSEAEWQELQAIDILAEEEAKSPIPPLTEKFKPIIPVNKSTKAHQV